MGQRTAELADAELVARSIAGDREAFSGIVARYQTLVCSVAYNGTGDLAQSEDLAQETFLSAWQQLRRLRDPEKLRSWLCGIARNLANNARRRLGREPAHRGETLEGLGELEAAQPWPAEEAITREREAILWRALERIPETYREPLILFYREQQSVERVAAPPPSIDPPVRDGGHSGDGAWRGRVRREGRPDHRRDQRHRPRAGA